MLVMKYRDGHGDVYRKLSLQRVGDVLDLLRQALDVGIPPPHLLAHNDLGSAAALLPGCLAALEPDEAVDLIDAAHQAALLDHARRRLLGAVPIEAEEDAQGVEANIS